MLEPYPLSALTCFGPTYGAGGFSGLDGQCCYVADCYTLADADTEPCLPSTATDRLYALIGPPGIWSL